MVCGQSKLPAKQIGVGFPYHKNQQQSLFFHLGIISLLVGRIRGAKAMGYSEPFLHDVQDEGT